MSLLIIPPRRAVRGVVGSGGGGGDPYWANVVFLAGFESGIVDESSSAHAISTFGSVAQSSGWSKSGTYSCIFVSGSTSHFTNTNPSSDFTFGTGDFTWEDFVNVTTLNGTLVDFRITAGNPNWTIYQSGGAWVFFANGANRISIGTLSAGDHLAVCRVSGVTRVFVNGSQRGVSYADSNNYTSTYMRVGDNFNGSSNAFGGYKDEIRVTKGVGRYSSPFTVPSAPFPRS